MKKNYIISTIIIGTLILFVFLLGTAFWTYNEAQSFMKTKLQEMQYVDMFRLTESREYLTEQDTLFGKCASQWEEWNFIPNTGFYGVLQMDGKAVYDTSSNYGIVADSEDNLYTFAEEKIFRFEEECPSETGVLSDIQIDSRCDDSFLYGGTLTYQGKTYKLGDFDYQGSEKVSFADWTGNKPIYAHIVRVDGGWGEKELDNDAKDLFYKLQASLSKGEKIITQKEDLWTSYYFILVNNGSTTYGALSLIHPMSTTLQRFTLVYLILLIALVIVEISLIHTMRKLYRTRKDFTERSRRLTRGVAHALKTPLAVTKAYVENWDYIDESERPEYKQKIIREVDEMTDQINSLLEIDKIDSGRVELNPVEVELSSLIRSVYNRLRPLAEERDLEVLMPEKDEYVVKADQRLMKMAIGNYLTNMLKYADKKASVKLSRSGKKIRVEFTNDISGNNENKSERISNNGMGLEINESIMKLHNFESGSMTDSRNTTFWFEAKEV